MIVKNQYTYTNRIATKSVHAADRITEEVLHLNDEEGELYVERKRAEGVWAE